MHASPAEPTAPQPAIVRALLALRQVDQFVQRFEVAYVRDLLARTGGNVAAAARLAGISRPNFHKKLRVLDVDAERFKQAARRGKLRDL